MKYLCLGYYTVDGRDRLTRDEYAAIVARCGPLDAELRGCGKAGVVASLVEHEVVTLRTRAGELSATDGPYVESKEQVGSFLIVEASDLNDAVRIASRHPAARLGEELGWALEVRPIGHLEEYRRDGGIR
ncbi:MAG: hypothetical protein EA404_09655 [Spirochaetaceae bacterium]|nr:MAG: hypothetical protein EA404_09655 [Spirochaetaceae bacterium]